MSRVYWFDVVVLSLIKSKHGLVFPTTSRTHRTRACTVGACTPSLLSEIGIYTKNVQIKENILMFLAEITMSPGGHFFEYVQAGYGY